MSTFARRAGLSYSLAAAVTVTSCGSSATPVAPSSPRAEPASSDPRRIVVLGDSLAVSPTRSDNFPSELQKRIAAAGLGWTVTNAGVSGDTTADGLGRFDASVPADTRILVLALGANDGLRGIRISAVEQNLAAIIERAQARAVRVLLCGMETPPMNGWNYTLEFHRIYPRLAGKYSVPLVPFLLAGVALNPELNGDDEIHPNAAGARRIADVVWPYLEALIQQESSAVTVGPNW